MMPSSGPPTPKGVGGPTPPPVSRGSEEEWKMRIPTWGPPTSNGGGVQRLPHSWGEGGVCPYRGERGASPYSKGGRGASPYSTGERGASPDAGREKRASPYPGREKEGRKEGGGEPAGPIIKIDTAGSHEPGTTHARPKREPPPQKGSDTHQRNRHNR